MTEIGEPTTTSRGRPRSAGSARPVSARCGSASDLARGRAPARRRRPTSRSSVIHSSRGLVTKNVPTALARSLSVRSSGRCSSPLARLVAEDLDQLGVHSLAAEPHLDQLAVGAAVQEVRERRALLPVPLDLGAAPAPSGRSCSRAWRASRRRGRSRPSPRARSRPAGTSSASTEVVSRRRRRSRAPARRRRSDRAGVPPAGCRTRPGPRPAGRSRPRCPRRPARAATGVDQRGFAAARRRSPEPRSSTSAFRPVDQRHVRVAEHREPGGTAAAGEPAVPTRTRSVHAVIRARRVIASPGRGSAAGRGRPARSIRSGDVRRRPASRGPAPGWLPRRR